MIALTEELLATAKQNEVSGLDAGVGISTSSSKGTSEQDQVNFLFRILIVSHLCGIKLLQSYFALKKRNHN